MPIPLTDVIAFLIAAGALAYTHVTLRSLEVRQQALLARHALRLRALSGLRMRDTR